MKTRFIAFAASEAMCAFIAWVGGFNFDQRGPSVAYGMFCALVFGGFVASYPGFGEAA